MWLPTLVLLAASTTPSASKIEWVATLEDARALASERGQLVFVAAHLGREGRSERFADDVYRDKAVVKHAQDTVNVVGRIEEHKKGKSCPVFSGVSCTEHRRAMGELRDGLLPANDQDVVALPQHLWLKPTGEVVLAVPFEMTAEELTWCFVAAQRAFDPDTELEFPEDARPPRRVVFGRAWAPYPGDRMGSGLRPEELEQDLEQLKRGRGREGFMLWLRVLFTDDDDAATHAARDLPGLAWLGGELLQRTVHLLGSLAPPRYHEVVELFAGDKSTAVRREVAVAFEQIGTADALRTVKSCLSKEREAELRPAWLRALGASGFGDKSARRTLLKALEDEDRRARLNALFALGYLDRHADVRAALGDALVSIDREDRLMAACAAALSRDPYYVDRLAQAVESAEDDAEREGLTTALEVLRGGSMHRIEELVRELAGDEARRERVFFGGPPRPPGRGGGGDGDGSDDD